MLPVLGTEPFHITEIAEAQKNFHLAFGRAFGQWALIEERLSYWFEDLTGMPYEMARAIFFTPRVFQSRTDLLQVAMQHTTRVSAAHIDFIKAATAKAGRLSSFRNRLAHGGQSFDAQKGSPTFKQVILIGGKVNPDLAAKSAVTISALDTATDNFRELARLLMDGTEYLQANHDPKDLLQQLEAISNQAETPRRT